MSHLIVAIALVVLFVKVATPARTTKSAKGNYEREFRRVRSTVLLRDHFRCRHCNRRGTKRNPLHVHHVVYRSRGGSNRTTNLLTLCKSCHQKVHGRRF